MKIIIYFVISIVSSFAALPPDGGDIGSIAKKERLFPMACGCNDCSMSSTFGPRKPPIAGATANHSGCDLRAQKGTELMAMAKGVVKKVVSGQKENGGKKRKGKRKGKKGYGNELEIEYTLSDGKKITVKYAHLEGVESGISEGTEVKPGQKVGTTGNTGTSTGPHLHAEVHIDGNKVDPAPYIDTEKMKQKCDAIRNEKNQNAPNDGSTAEA